ncbi:MULTISPECIES: AMP-binding protein [unclassified Photorhabdus]|uniref:AMP-binding protein n=1 Tax=unclassified Photorhabdus TaxID=2620880 RepID=UPI000DCB757E|nr:MULTISPECIES: AMP-binding protein [unclassified Photorhabdus]RAW93236.1 hypothetical protein CKY03_22235 [Photorhabdus sp. S9-53]RAW93308.1 hypothetical protein CKY05_22170 [Photorhabdus sp. S10-54]RAW96795.1 hypothetical protein CKY04_22240 [Photorhabdus sp. S8-52]
MINYDSELFYLRERERLVVITGYRAFDYQEFRQVVPISKRIYPPVAMNTMLNSAMSDAFPMLIGATSGTTGAMKVVRTTLKTGGGSISTSERNFIRRLKEKRIFTEKDVIGNLFTINLFSSLHHSACEIAKYCHASIIPIGDIALLYQCHYHFLAEAGLTVLFGVPATIIQFIESMIRQEIYLPISKIVFTGESLRESHEKYLRSILGAEITIIGLYGLSECGFLGISTDRHSHYELFLEDFFFEYDDQLGLLVTSLDPGASFRVIRYPTGDNVNIVNQDNTLYLTDIERNLGEFNFMGNIISHKKLANFIENQLPDALIQIVLSSDADVREHLVVRICSEQLNNDNLKCLQEQVRQIPELYEVYSKQRGTISLIKSDERDFSLSPRGKHMLLIDNRE